MSPYSLPGNPMPSSADLPPKGIMVEGWEKQNGKKELDTRKRKEVNRLKIKVTNPCGNLTSLV